MMKGKLADLMKQAQKMQEAMQRAQEELAQMEIEGQSGAGMVRIMMTGRHEVRRVAIDTSLFGDDRDMIEDLLVAAFNDAIRKVEEATKEKMSPLSAGLPSGLNLPF
ncbi:MAG: YbaB/EbfC family nucleoid-associated protein [Burkholderiales bacterium]|jgi:DNA-binding YbaB/EbfC family protein|nr:YbaB/EbfC family nucleoid-associated protein [Burkholderiales bacterium]